MLKRLFPITLFVLITTAVFAQNPRPIEVTPADPNQPEGIFACAPGFGNEAGTKTLGAFVGSSNDFDLDTIYLCMDDQILIDHDAGTASFAGDPSPTSPGGIGYAVYDCPPTGAFNGDLSAIQSDPCITSLPLPPGGAGNLPYVATIDVSGDIPFINNGGIQTYFGGGAPVLKWFAPITYDSLGLDITGAPVAFYQDNGPCVDVNEEEAFAVVYLNAIDSSNLQVTGCAGSFNIAGGLPEFDANENYNISITLVTDPTISATIINGNSTSNGDNVDFQVPVLGTYNVVVADTKGCPLSFTVDMSGCSALTMNLGNVAGITGSQVCVPVTVEGFDNIASFQYSIVWDPTIIDYASINYAALTNVNGDLIINQVGDALSVTFFDFINSQGTTLADGTLIFEVCFNILGPTGSSSPVDIDGSLTIIDVYNDDQDQLALVTNNGSVTVVNQGAFDIGITPNDVTCFGLTNGSIDVVVNGTGGGVAPYTFSWVEIGTPANNGSIIAIPNNGMVSQSGLGAGTYAISISDSGNPVVTDLDTIQIIEPPLLGASITDTQPLCFGANNGSLTANVIINSVIVSNPGPEFTFLWSPGGATDQTINNFDPLLGTYSVTITNGNMCTAVASLTPTQPAQLTVDLDVTDAACSGINNGQIEATPMGGIGAAGYVYAWSTTPVQTTAIATNLGIGTYTVTVTDNNMCTATATSSVSAATIIFAGANVQNVTCNGLDNGAIFYNPQVIGVDNGGYTYQWSPNVSMISNASPIPAGTYTTTITDALGCNVDTTVIILEPAAIEIVGMITTTDETCTVGSDGTASVVIAGGTPSVVDGYNYSWNCCVGQDTDNVSGVPAGNYIVTILDSLGCNTSAQFTINPPTPPTIVSFDSIGLNCPSDTNGSLTVNAMMGNAAITGYSWIYPNGTTNTGSTINNLGPGNYIVTVTAADGCMTVDSFLLWAPTPLVLVQSLPTNPTCYGDSTGTAAVQMSGGTMPYQYQWSANAGSSTNSAVPLLAAGTYTVTVIDDKMCDEVITEVILVNPDSITVAVDNSTIVPLGCFGQLTNCDGGATALASGGNAPSGIYTFSWMSSGEITIGMSSAPGVGVASQLCAGPQVVTVIDENNCSNSITVIIPEPPMLGITSVLTEPTCNGDIDGSIELTGIGGTPGYIVDWAGGTTGTTLANIPAGNYPVTITDFNGCELDTIMSLGEPALLEATIDSLANVSCSGDIDGFVSVTFTGGNGGPMVYDWAGGVAPTTSSAASNLAPGTYTVTVTDVNGCSDVVTAFITEPIPVFAVIPMAEEPICFGDQTLLTVLTAAGGVGAPYTFTIDGGPAQNIGTAINVFAGNHTIVVSDGNGCTYVEDIFINQPPAIEVNLGPDVEIQLGESTVLNAVLSGSNVPIDSIIWTPSIFDTTSCTSCLTPIVSPIDNQLYTVEIFDINGCNGSDDILVEVDKNRNVYIPNVFTPNGDGYNDVFQVFSGPGVTQINSIIVFDRWGEVVFEAKNITPTGDIDYDNGWDGELRGRVMNPGVFIYLVDVTFDDGVNLLFRGDVTLLH